MENIDIDIPARITEVFIVRNPLTNELAGHPLGTTRWFVYVKTPAGETVVELNERIPRARMMSRLDRMLHVGKGWTRGLRHEFQLRRLLEKIHFKLVWWLR